MAILSSIKKHLVITSAFAIIVVILAVLIGRKLGSSDTVVVDKSEKTVVLVNALSFREGSDTVRANGIIESRGQADLKSQMSATVSVTNGAIGDSVYAGQTILELQNSDIKAQLEQAKASLALAQGQYYTGGVSLDSARGNALNVVRDAYLKGYDAVNTDIDPLLNNTDGNGSHLSTIITDSALSNKITAARIDLIAILRDWKTTTDSLSASSSVDILNSSIKLSLKNIVAIDSLLANISEALNDSAQHSTPAFTVFLNSWKGIVSGARASISGASQSLSASEAVLTGAGASYSSTAPAQVAAAKAGVDNLEAQLAKTIIRSPIDGKIAALPIGIGELATPGQLLATVVGDSGIEVKAYASGDDLSRIKVGAPVTIQSNMKGTVKSVAPNVSDVNRKVEVIVSVDQTATSSLVIGQNVQVAIQASKIQTVRSSISSDQKNIYLLPIQDVKIIPGNAFVYTVDGDSKIKKNAIVLGNINGDFVEVVEGITDDMDIVSPVYELDEGEVVSAQ